jgi:hypothetical protein
MTDERVSDLLRRLERIEDEREIQRMIASYGPLVDAGAAEAAADLWASDGSYDVEGWAMHSREDVAAMVRSEAHQGLVNRGCSHFLGPAVVTVDGADAVAVCESVLLLHRGDGFVAARAGANHFRLKRIDDRWQIIQRTSRTLDGNPEARGLLTAGIAGS